MKDELPPQLLSKTYDLSTVNDLLKESDHKPVAAIIGQERAVKALEFGLGNKARGYNIYVSGQPGTGRHSAIKHYLSELSAIEAPPSDWCYVNNFKDPYYPKKIALPKGSARKFKTDIERFIYDVAQNLVKTFNSEEIEKRREAILENWKKEENILFFDLNERAKKENFLITRLAGEIRTAPAIEGRPITEEEFNSLSEKEQKALMKKSEEIKEDIKSSVRNLRKIEKKYSEMIVQLEQEIVHLAVDLPIEVLRKKYDSITDVKNYLEELHGEVLEHYQDFLKPKKELIPGISLGESEANILKKYEVNVLVDHSETEGTPIVLELNPTYNNLFGKVEKISQMGVLLTDFTLIRRGALHQANGGYLVLPIKELLLNYFSWDSLKRALRNQQIEIEEIGERLGYLSNMSLKPEPIPLNIQVILIGNPQLYFLLYDLDEDFRELFKVKAEFDSSMEISHSNLRDFIALVKKIAYNDQLLPLAPSALVRIMEHAHRLSEDQDKISTKFGSISDLLKESNYYAQEAKTSEITDVHVEEAINEKIFRSGLLKEKIQEWIEKGIILIDTAGERVGQVNGIAVVQFGDQSFGRPNRITVSTTIGKEGIIDIEREAKLGGPIHTKGVMILSGYLAEKYGREHPISMSARLVFEQSYGEIEGDSASSTELYALLSALSGLPIRQGIAVTGSVNQKGDIQAVGGINEKIEGFFEVCLSRGLDGQQGVIIPQTNQKNLVLKKEVIEAVRKGKFHLWAVKTVDEGIEILTGVKAGKITSDALGHPVYEKDSVHELVNNRLLAITEKLRDMSGPTGIFGK